MLGSSGRFGVRILGTAAGALLALNGCASIVKKPEINTVTKVAVLSLYANQTVPEEKGRGVVTQWDNAFRMEVAENALHAVEQELANKMNWEVVPGQTVIQSPAYQEAFAPKANTSSEGLNKAMGMFAKVVQQGHDARFFTPPGMHPILLHGEKGQSSSCWGNNCPPDPKTRLAELAKQLGVDAVVVVQLDYCYGGGTWSLGGTGEAKMTAGTAIRAVSKDGQMIVDMNDVPKCAGDNRAQSENSMFMNGGDLVFITAGREKMRNMFVQATQSSMGRAVAQVQAAMK